MSPELLRQTAYDYLAAQLKGEFSSYKIELSKLDPRLQLQDCEHALEAFLPTGARPWGNTTVGLRCNGLKPWSLFIAAQVQAYKKVVITTRPVPRDSSLAAADLAYEERDITSLGRGYLENLNDALGMTLRNAMAAHTPLTPMVLAKPRLVKRGQRVTILAETRGLQVRMNGTALTEGGEGDLIKVRSHGNKHIIEGRVVDVGVIRLSL